VVVVMVWLMVLVMMMWVAGLVGVIVLEPKGPILCCIKIVDDGLNFYFHFLFFFFFFLSFLFFFYF